MLFSLATMPKSGDEAEQLANLGEGIGYAVKGAASEMAVYGVYVTICSLAVYAVWTRKMLASTSPRRSRLIYLLLPSLLITFVFTTFTAIFSIMSLVSIVSNTLVQNQEMSIPERVEMYAERREPGWVANGEIVCEFAVGGPGGGMVFVVNNALIIWRALSVWPRSRLHYRPLVALFLGVLVFSTFALAIAALVIRFLKISIVFPLHDTDRYKPLDMVISVGAFFTFLLNAVASGVFWYIVGKHRALAVAKGAKFKKRRVLWFFFESGLIYVVLQMVRILVRGSVDDGTELFGTRMTAANVVMRMTGIVWAMYAPTLILILSFGHSLSDVVHSRSRPRAPSLTSEPVRDVHREDLWTASVPPRHHRQGGQEGYSMTVGAVC